MKKWRHEDVVLILSALLLSIVLSSGFSGIVHQLGNFANHKTINIAFVVFVGTQIFTTAWKIRDERLARERITSGLLHEIERNLIEQERDRIDEVVIQDLKTFVTANPEKIPMIVLSFNDVFYKGVARDLPTIHREQLQAVNDFYFCVTQLRNAAASIEGKAFLHVGVQSRTEVFDIILASYNETVRSGQNALELLKKKPPIGGFFGWCIDLFKP